MASANADATSLGSSAPGGSGTGDESPAEPNFPEPGPPGGDACPGLSCLPCGNGVQCAQAGAPIGDSCCAAGDALLHRGVGVAAEAVDVEVEDDLVFLCGGFGVRINDVSDATAPRYVARAAGRCQRIAIGPELDAGRRLFWLAHHGDTWVETPFLATYIYDPSSDEVEATALGRIEDASVLFEGMTYRNGFLYAATHGTGLHTYRIGDDHLPVLETVTGGFENATKVAVSGDHLYVADQRGGVHVLSLANPENPLRVATIAVSADARDVAVHDDVLAVSMGGSGVDVFDVSDPTRARLHGHLDSDGTAQAVDVDACVIAVAAWTHVALYDRVSLQLLATERVKPSPQFEQDFGIAIEGDLVHVAEWEQHHVLEYRPGLVAPDIWAESDLIEFDPDDAGERVVVVRNRGYLDLDVEEIALEEGPFTVDTARLRVPPQSARALEVAYTPEGSDAYNTLRFVSNDPDAQQSPLLVPVSAIDSERVDVGDQLPDKFGFLDPNGLGDVQGLRGHVVVLAYFALF